MRHRGRRCNIAGGVQDLLAGGGRLGLAQALIGHPRLLLLDEPTSGLDPSLRKEVYGIIGELARNGATVLLSSHALAEIEPEVDRVVALIQGRKVADGTISYPQASIAVAREADRTRRKAVAYATRQVTRELNAQRMALLKLEHKLVQTELGFPHYRAFYEMVRGIDFAART